MECTYYLLLFIIYLLIINVFIISTLCINICIFIYQVAQSENSRMQPVTEDCAYTY